MNVRMLAIGFALTVVGAGATYELSSTKTMLRVLVVAALLALVGRCAQERLGGGSYKWTVYVQVLSALAFYLGVNVCEAAFAAWMDDVFVAAALVIAAIAAAVGGFQCGYAFTNSGPVHRILRQLSRLSFFATTLRNFQHRMGRSS